MSTALKTPPTTAPGADLRRITEADPDYQRLHQQTTARLIRSLKQYIREEQLGEQGADSRFIQRHVALMKQAYVAAHHEGQKDYWPAVSRRTIQHRFIQPDEQQTQKRLTYYALGSVLKLAHQVKTYVQQQKSGTLDEPEYGLTIQLYNPYHDSHGRFTTGGGATTTVAKGQGRTKRGPDGGRVKNEQHPANAAKSAGDDLKPVRHVPLAEWDSLQVGGSDPTAHYLKALYGQAQLAAALGRYSKYSLDRIGREIGIGRQANKATAIRKIVSHMAGVSDDEAYVRATSPGGGMIPG